MTNESIWWFGDWKKYIAPLCEFNSALVGVRDRVRDYQRGCDAMTHQFRAGDCVTTDGWEFSARVSRTDNGRVWVETGGGPEFEVISPRRLRPSVTAPVCDVIGRLAKELTERRAAESLWFVQRQQAIEHLERGDIEGALAHLRNAGLTAG